MTFAAISHAGGVSATHGELRLKSKYTAPVSRTARSTSERTSAFTSRPAPDARAFGSDVWRWRRHWQTNGKANRTLAHGSDVGPRRTLGDTPGNDAPAIVQRTSL